jgi:hypothetical protein
MDKEFGLGNKTMVFENDGIPTGSDISKDQKPEIPPVL